jgi:hypothetical protein
MQRNIYFDNEQVFEITSFSPSYIVSGDIDGDGQIEVLYLTEYGEAKLIKNSICYDSIGTSCDFTLSCVELSNKFIHSNKDSLILMDISGVISIYELAKIDEDNFIFHFFLFAKFRYKPNITIMKSWR